MRTKQLTIRIPLDFHQQLVAYAESNYLPVSRVITQAVAKTIAYKPQKATPRSIDPVEPEEHWEELRPEDYAPLDTDFTDEEWKALQRRAASAPVKPI